MIIGTFSPPSQPSWFARLALGAVRCYQRCLSPLTPPSCRYTPTCSEYTAQAIMRYGALRGVWMGLKRIVRCNPWTPGGYDPVPGTTESMPETPCE